MAFSWRNANEFFQGFNPGVESLTSAYKSKKDKEDELKKAMALLGFKGKLDQDAKQMEQRRDTFGMNAPTNDEMGAMQNFPYGQSVNVPGTNLGPIASQIIGDVGLPVPPAPSIVRGMPDNYVNANAGTVSTKAQSALADPSAMLSMKTGVPRKTINQMNMQNDIITGRAEDKAVLDAQKLQTKISIGTEALKQAGFNPVEAEYRAKADAVGMSDVVKNLDAVKKDKKKRNELMTLAIMSVGIKPLAPDATDEQRMAYAEEVANNTEVQKKFLELANNKTSMSALDAIIAAAMKGKQF